MLPSEFVPPTAVVPYELAVLREQQLAGRACAPFESVEVVQTLNTRPTGSNANIVPMPLLPPPLATP